MIMFPTYDTIRSETKILDLSKVSNAYKWDNSQYITKPQEVIHYVTFVCVGGDSFQFASTIKLDVDRAFEHYETYLKLRNNS